MMGCWAGALVSAGPQHRCSFGEVNQLPLEWHLVTSGPAQEPPPTTVSTLCQAQSFVSKTPAE